MNADFNSRLSQVYSAGRVLTPEARDAWMTALGRCVGNARPQSVLDLGAGVGRFSPSLAEFLGGPVYAVEPAAKMLRVARRLNVHSSVTYIQARAEQLPLRAGVCDVAFLFLTYHHFSRPVSAMAEVSRVLRPGTPVFIRTEFSDRPHQVLWHKYLSESAARDVQMYPTFESLCGVLNVVGMSPIESIEVRYVAATSLRDYIRRLRLRPLSALQATSDDELAIGLERLESDMHEQMDEPVYQVARAIIARRQAR